MRRPEEWVDPTLIALDPNNSNAMTKRQFNALVEAVRDTGGLTENVVAVDMRDEPTWSDVEHPFLCVSGEHRTRAAIAAGIKEVPVRLFSPQEWDADQRDIQGMRHNILSGDFNAKKFANTVDRLATKYGSRENVRELLKFTDKAKFDKLIEYAVRGLPSDVREGVRKAQREGRVESVDQLSTILNQLMSAYGDTLPLGFMILDYGGKQHVWVRLTEPSRKALREVRGDLVRARKSLDAFMAAILTQHDVVRGIIEELPVVEEPDRGELYRQDPAKE